MSFIFFVFICGLENLLIDSVPKIEYNTDYIQGDETVMSIENEIPKNPYGLSGRVEFLKRIGCYPSQQSQQNPYDVINKVENELKKNSPIDFTVIEKGIDDIIRTGDILQIYELFFLIVDIRSKQVEYTNLNDLGINKIKLEKLQSEILESKNAKLIRYCIGFIPGIDLDRYLKALYATESYWDIRTLSYGRDYIDAEEVANPKLLKKVKLDEYSEVLNKASKKRKKYFPNSLDDYKENKDNTNLLAENIIGTKNPYLICELAYYIEHLKDMKPEEKKMYIEELAKAEMNTSDPMGIYEFLSSVESISQNMFKSMVNKIKTIGDAKYMRYVKDYTFYGMRTRGKLIEETLEMIEKENEKENVVGGDGI